MSNEVFAMTLFTGFMLVLAWGFRVLPREKWQIFATLPIRRLESGQWQGVNLTWYGLLTANAYLAAMAMLIILLGAVQVPLTIVLAVAVLLLGLCVPSSRLIARWVEGKQHTFTVGGAVFVGIVAAPGTVVLVDSVPGISMPVVPTLAALAVAYAFGEGLGRLACISFGCCYGKPVGDCPPLVRKIFNRWSFAFEGEMKKISYASRLEGRRVIPVQALTAVLYIITGVGASYLFLEGNPPAAFILAIVVTQGWRVYSETLRADYRGQGRISVYQLMGLLAIPYCILVPLFFPDPWMAAPQLSRGLADLWQPGMVLFLQSLWVLLFVYTGRSTVTGASLSFHVHHDRI